MNRTICAYGLIFLMLITGCRHEQSAGDNRQRKTTDMLGREVAIPNTIEKIVALNAGMLRLICWMDATDKVCGVEYNERRRHVPYLFAYPELREKPVIGTGNMPEPELLLSVAPDVIFSTYISKTHADELQARTGIPVLAVRYGNLDDEKDTLFRALEYIGKILNKSDRADFLVNYIQKNIQDIEKRTASVADSLIPEVYVGGIAYRGSHGITSTEPRYPPFRFLHAKNVAGSLDAVMTSERDVLTNAFIDKEQLIKWNPEYIFLDMSSTAYSGSGLNAEWVSVLSAVKNENIFTVYPYNWYTINYSTILVNAWFIGKVLYPEQFSDIDPETKGRDIYKNILGKDVYDEMVKKFGTCRKITPQNE